MDHTSDGLTCPACPAVLTAADLPVGTHVRVPHRRGATGTVTEAARLGDVRGLVSIRFNGGEYGLNYARQCEVI